MHWEDKLQEFIENTFYYIDMGIDEPELYIKPQWKWIEKFLVKFRN